MESAIDPAVLAMAQEFIDRVRTGRAVAALKAILQNGSVTTEDLSRLGYEHPPRAIADVKDQGFPIIRTMIVTADGRKMARYSLGTADQIRLGQVGRTSFSKKFRTALFTRYGSVDQITRAEHDPRTLQIDHRIPYRVGGDAGLSENDVEAFMLLDAKSQRAKSWSCENCRNFIQLRDPGLCRSCFWAYPEQYEHVAMSPTRRADVVWQGAEVAEYDKLNNLAQAYGIDLPHLLKRLGREAIQ